MFSITCYTLSLANVSDCIDQRCYKYIIYLNTFLPLLTEHEGLDCVGGSNVISTEASNSTHEACGATLSLPTDKPSGEHFPHSPSSFNSLESLLLQVDDSELSKAFIVVRSKCCKCVMQKH